MYKLKAQMEVIENQRQFAESRIKSIEEVRFRWLCFS